MRHVLVEALLGLVRLVDSAARQEAGKGRAQGADEADDDEGRVHAGDERLLGRDVDVGDVVAVLQNVKLAPVFPFWGAVAVVVVIGVTVLRIVCARRRYGRVT